MATINIRVDDSTKEQASQVFKDIGMDMTTAIKVFLNQAIKTKGIPFELTAQSTESMMDEIFLNFSKDIVKVDMDNPEHVKMMLAD